MPMERFVLNIDRYGNTSTASIPIAFCEAFDQGRVRVGDNLVLVGFGAGLTWGAMAIQLTEPERIVTPIEKRRWRIFAFLARLRSLLRRIGRRLESLIFRADAKGKQPQEE